MTPGVRLIDVVVVVFPVTGARVVGRVDIDAIDPAGIKPFKQLEGVVVVGLKEQVMRRIASLLEALDRYDGGGKTGSPNRLTRVRSAQEMRSGSPPLSGTHSAVCALIC
jgi:hypothetical protein